MDLGVHELNYLAQSYWHHFRFRLGEMIGLDRQRREVQVAPVVDEDGNAITPQRAFHYDTLVIAVGSLTNDFNTPGVMEHAIALETSGEASRFHRRLVNALMRAHAQPEPFRPEQLQVAIIGAGATGVELAAELHNTTRELVAYGLDRIDPDQDIKLNVIEAADRILPALPQRLSDAATKLLQSKGVRVRTSARVAEVLPNGVRLVSGEIIPAELVVWAAGVKAPDFCQGSGRTRDEPHEPIDREADTPNNTGREYLRHWRLRRLSLAGERCECAATRAGCASTGNSHGQTNRKPA
jgi:NADH dehydrogenase